MQDSKHNSQYELRTKSRHNRAVEGLLARKAQNDHPPEVGRSFWYHQVSNTIQLVDLFINIFCQLSMFFTSSKLEDCIHKNLHGSSVHLS